MTGSSSPLFPQPLIHSAASSLAELVSCAILTPAEVIKQNAQMVDGARARANNSNATLQTLSRFRSNPLALWSGYTALAGRNLPFTALQFPMFERLKEGIKTYRDDKGTRTNTLLESGTITAASAGLAGSVAAVVTTPVDVIKTRIMLGAARDGGQKDQKAGPTAGSQKAPAEAVGKSMAKGVQASKEGLKSAIGNVTKPGSRKTALAIAKDIVAEQGVKGLFRGGALRAVWTMLGSGLYLGVYEAGRIHLAKRRGVELDEEDIT